MENRMDIFIIMIVMLVNCMQTVYLAFVLSNKWELPVFIEGDISPQFNILFFISKLLKTKLKKAQEINTLDFFILLNHSLKQAENKNSTWAALPVCSYALWIHKPKQIQTLGATVETKSAWRACSTEVKIKREAVSLKGTTTTCQDSTENWSIHSNTMSDVFFCFTTIWEVPDLVCTCHY